MLFFVQTVLDAENFTSLFLMLYFTGLLLGIPFFAWLAKKMQSKIKAWKLSMILIVVIFSFCIFLSSGDIWQYALICLASGFCFGADYCLSYSILTDIIQDEDLQTRQTSIFGSINFIIKFCFAFASGILIFLLGWVQAEFPDSQTSFLLISYCLLPCFFKIITYLTLNNFLKEYA
jgi:MFS family permease